MQSEEYNYLGNIGILEDKIQFYSEKLEELGELDMTLAEIEDQSHSFSMSVSRIGAEERRKIRMFSTLEKLTFSKI